MTNLEKLVQLYKDSFGIDDLDPDVVKIIDEGEWEQDHKYQHRQTIVQMEEQFFSVGESRSGSYHTDWYYGDTYIFPVDRVEETRVVVSWKSTAKPVCVAGRD